MFNFSWSLDVQSVRQKMEEIWTSLGQAKPKLQVGNTCPICLNFVWIGERHSGCIHPTNPQDTCIICAKDERFGDHSKCIIETRRRRNEVIEIFRNSR